MKHELARADGLCDPRVRDATAADMAAVQAIYAAHVLHGLATFEEEAPSATQLAARRARALALGLPYLVAELEGVVVGYAYAAPFHARSAFRCTIEDSIYVRQDLGGRGVGSALLRALIERCEGRSWRQMVAVIGDSANLGSLALHRKFGFRLIGVLTDVGFKFGRWVDAPIMQRELRLGSGLTSSSDSPS